MSLEVSLEMSLEMSLECPSKEIHTFGVVIFRVYFYNIK